MLNFTSNEVQNFLNSENALFHYTKLKYDYTNNKISGENDN
jgi:hypothetical protein